MNVIAINGSPHKNGNTAAALGVIAEELQKHDISTEIITIGHQSIRGCNACGNCAKTGECIFDDDGVNEIAEKIIEADGLLVGSPVYYAGINGTLKSFLDRAFYSHSAKLRLKPCASVVVARRAGTTASLQTINHYFQIAEMMMGPTTYWSGVHGNGGGDAVGDLEGMQIMRQLGKNMAFVMKMMDETSVPLPEKDQRIKYNYIR